MGAKAMAPSQRPSAVSVSPLGKAQATAQLKWAARVVWPRMPLSSSMYRPRSSRSSPP